MTIAPAPESCTLVGTARPEETHELALALAPIDDPALLGHPAVRSIRTDREHAGWRSAESRGRVRVTCSRRTDAADWLAAAIAVAHHYAETDSRPWGLALVVGYERRIVAIDVRPRPAPVPTAHEIAVRAEVDAVMARGRS